MSRPQPRSTRPYTLFPPPTLFRSSSGTPGTPLSGTGSSDPAPEPPSAVVVVASLVTSSSPELPQAPAKSPASASPARVRHSRACPWVWFIDNVPPEVGRAARPVPEIPRSEEHTSELQSLMRISYAVFCLKKKNNKRNSIHKTERV